MNAQMTKIVITLIALCALGGQSAWGQFGGGAGGGTDNQAAGSASTLSSQQGYGLDSRFLGSGFDMYTTGSTAMGTVTAGGRAGGAALGNTGGGNNSFSSLSGLGTLGILSGMRGGGFGGMMGGRNMFGGQNNQQQGQGNKVIRTRATLGFARPVPSSTAVSASYGKVIGRVLARDDFGGGNVNMAMVGRVAVLKGTVGSAHARDVAERLALLEPGIAEVRNELTVLGPAPTRGTSPTTSVGDRSR